MPSYPKLFPPIEYTFPLSVKTSVWKIPASADNIVYYIDGICTGNVHFDLDPVPSYPASPLPQIYNLPNLSTNAVCRVPHETCLILTS